MSRLLMLSEIIRKDDFFVPVNLSVEKEKFLGDDSYEPFFEYAPLDFNPDDFKKQLEQEILNNSFDDERVRVLFQGVVRDLMLHLELLRARGTNDFSHKSLMLFGRPSRSLLLRADSLLNDRLRSGFSSDNKRESKSLSSDEVVSLLSSKLEELSLSGWRVVLDNSISGSFSVSNLFKSVKINPDSSISVSDVNRFVARELLVTVRRFVNGSSQPLSFLSVGTDHFLETEEGLKLFFELREGFDDSLFRAALLLRAVDVALNNGFRSVFEFLSSFVSVDEAFFLASLVKGGCGDSSLPGANVIPSLAFSGFEKINSLPADDVDLLMIGRISFNVLPLVKDLLSDGLIKKVV